MASHGLLVACRPKDHHDSRFKSKIRDPSRLRFTIMIQIWQARIEPLSRFKRIPLTIHDHGTTQVFIDVPAAGFCLFRTARMRCEVLHASHCRLCSTCRFGKPRSDGFLYIKMQHSCQQFLSKAEFGLQLSSVECLDGQIVCFSRKKSMRLQSVFFVHLVLLFE